MTGLAGLASLLEEHEAVGWMVDSRGEQAWTCACGESVDLPPEHHAHVAAAVTAWLAERLGSEEVREAVEAAVRRAAHDVRRQNMSRNEQRADAALAAVVGALAGES